MAWTDAFRPAIRKGVISSRVSAENWIFPASRGRPTFFLKRPFSGWFSACGRSGKVAVLDREKGCAFCYNRGYGRLHCAPDSGDGCDHADRFLSSALLGGPGPALIIANRFRPDAPYFSHT